MKNYMGLILLLLSIYGYTQNNKEINNLLNNWHYAASVADEITFFDTTFSADGIYIGTDETELWTVTEMKEWSKQYFDKDSAWDFKVKSRNIYYSKSKKVAWFDELLATWMGTCRGSGVLEKQKGKWELKHYHLSIAVPNEVIQDYLKLIGK